MSARTYNHVPGQPLSPERSILLHLAVAAASALLLTLSFPEPGWWPLAFVALVPIGTAAVRSRHTTRLAWTAALVFFIWSLFMFRWMAPVTVGGMIGLAVAHSFFNTSALLLARRLHRKLGWGMFIALPLMWVSIEFFRSHTPFGGLAWFTMGHPLAPYDAAHGTSRLIQIADLFGEFAPSVLVVMTNGLIIDLITRPLMRATRHDRSRLKRGMVVALGAWAVLMIGTFAYGQWRISQHPRVTEQGPNIAVVQTNVPQDNKNFPTTEQIIQDWRDMVALTIEAGEMTPRPDLIVWPETMVHGPLNPEARDLTDGQAYHEQISVLASEHTRAALLVGGRAAQRWEPVTTEDGQQYLYPQQRYNSVFLYHHDGTQDPQRYDKIYRVPFGEYIPVADSWPWLKRLFISAFSPHGQDYSLTAGQQRSRFELAWAQNNQPVYFVTPICFEDVVARATRQLIYNDSGRKTAQVIVNVTNSAWYPLSHQQPQHLQMAVFRSIENRVPTARSVNHGISGFIDSVGRVGPTVTVDGRRHGVEGVVAHEMLLDSRETFYGRWGGLPMALFTLTAAGVVLASAFRRGNIDPASRRSVR